VEGGTYFSKAPVKGELQTQGFAGRLVRIDFQFPEQESTKRNFKPIK
jgi:hypothetical protein